jgi:hypothetical protein
MEWCIRIPKDRDPGKPWDRLLEQLQLFDVELGRHDREPGDVSARVCEACDQAGSDWIGDGGHDDGDGGRGTLGRLGSNRIRCDDHIDFMLE